MGDGLPELICAECLDRLNNAFEFRKQCETSDKTLRQLGGIGEISVKFEENGVSNEPALFEDNNVGNIEVEVDIKSENSFTKNDFDLNDTCDITDSDDDSEDEPLSQRIKKRNQNDENTFAIIDVKSENTEANANKSSDERKEQLDEVDSENDSLDKAKKTRKKQNITSKKRSKEKIQVTPQEGTPCPKCKECFELQSDLELHMILHEKTLNCTKCVKSFKTRRSFTRHVRKHMVIKPYRCTICTKGFTESSYYVRHLRVHTGTVLF